MMKYCLALMLVLYSFVNANFGVGLRDNQYGYVSYIFNKTYDVKLEHSLYSEKIAFQYCRLNLSSHFMLASLAINQTLYIGSLYNRDYFNAGYLLGLEYPFFYKFVIIASGNPHYDSELGIVTNYLIGGNLKIYKDIRVTAAYTTVPEYRLSEKRIRAGFILGNDFLTVSPIVSLPAKVDLKNMRILVSFAYQF